MPYHKPHRAPEARAAETCPDGPVTAAADTDAISCVPGTLLSPYPVGLVLLVVLF